jgi:hypothetical protein
LPSRSDCPSSRRSRPRGGSTVCPQRPNGNTPAGLVPRRVVSSGMTARPWPPSLGAAKHRRRSFGRSGRDLPTHGACRTCTATSASGARIGTTNSITSPVATTRLLIPPGRPTEPSVWSAAEIGGARPPPCVRRHAATHHPRAATSAGDFALCAPSELNGEHRAGRGDWFRRPCVRPAHNGQIGRG